jgi:nitrogen regulatory protein PII
MKAVFIIYNQANTERVEYLFDRLAIRGFTTWEKVDGRGSVDGQPRMGTHTWPEMNSATITVVEDDRVDELLKYIKKLDERNKEIGVRAFVWNVEQFV